MGMNRQQPQSGNIGVLWHATLHLLQCCYRGRAQTYLGHAVPILLDLQPAVAVAAKDDGVVVFNCWVVAPQLQVLPSPGAQRGAQDHGHIVLPCIQQVFSLPGGAPCRHLAGACCTACLSPQTLRSSRCAGRSPTGRSRLTQREVLSERSRRLRAAWIGRTGGVPDHQITCRHTCIRCSYSKAGPAQTLRAMLRGMQAPCAAGIGVTP